MSSWKGVIDLYIDPIVVGVLGTILVEIMVLIAYGIYEHVKR